ncbi:DNA polymerase III subunit tau [Novipirellula galeiformis]|uniref:DNA polymerase III subunit tau n=1 Tax=Novipirellula galeiformis TaxID=2528004 RepID=A0A5C6CAP3_9BACT|nr:DNA polymerase III subunit delta' [Novipirellula galeiformis]TWU21660.1 DNA polymerase III subunit tau [Novipirellula galeiformis]
MMSTNWSNLIGHKQIENWFATAIRKGHLTGSFLFVGQPGVGKRTTANLLARTLLCERNAPEDMNPCGVCEGCVQVAAGTHPDVTRVSKPNDKSFIPLELLIGPPDSRMQEGFCRDVRLKPMRGRRRVAMIEDADFLNEEGANCLLKTLEEPSSNAVILLIGTSEQRQLPTIRSRCRVIRFQSPSSENAQRLMREVHSIEATDQQIAEAVEVSGGDMHVAVRLLSGEADKLRDALRSQFGSRTPDPVALCRMINAHVEQAGKEAAKRRAAMRDVFSFAVQHYRQQLRQGLGDRLVTQHSLNRLDRSIRALREVDRSANQSTLIECYSADIAAATTGDRGEIG